MIINFNNANILENKYLKYKTKYLNTKNQLGGAQNPEPNAEPEPESEPVIVPKSEFSLIYFMHFFKDKNSYKDVKSLDEFLSRYPRTVIKYTEQVLLEFDDSDKPKFDIGIEKFIYKNDYAYFVFIVYGNELDKFNNFLVALIASSIKQPMNNAMVIIYGYDVNKKTHQQIFVSLRSFIPSTFILSTESTKKSLTELSRNNTRPESNFIYNIGDIVNYLKFKIEKIEKDKTRERVLSLQNS